MSATLATYNRFSNNLAAPYKVDIPYFFPFYTSQVWAPSAGPEPGSTITGLSALIVAGGGGGGYYGYLGNDGGGGGGAGGVRFEALSINPLSSFVVVIGTGGSGGSLSTAGSKTYIRGLNHVAGLTAEGGGKGGDPASISNGGNGGSGGGGIGWGAIPGTLKTGGTGTAGEGSNGGSNSSSADAGGGGGKLTAGSDGNAGSHGGDGVYYNLKERYGIPCSGAYVPFAAVMEYPLLSAGGGGGGGYNSSATNPRGGRGGGGRGGYRALVGSNYVSSPPTSGVNYTGGGGGGGTQSDSTPGIQNGGCGFAAVFGVLSGAITINKSALNLLTGNSVLIYPSVNGSNVINFDKTPSITLAAKGLSGWESGYIIVPPYGQRLTLDYSLSGGAGATWRKYADEGNTAGGKNFTGDIITGYLNLSGAIYVSPGGMGGKVGSTDYKLPGVGFFNGGAGAAKASLGNQDGQAGGAPSVIINSNGLLIACAGGGAGGVGFLGTSDVTTSRGGYYNFNLDIGGGIPAYVVGNGSAGSMSSISSFADGAGGGGGPNSDNGARGGRGGIVSGSSTGETTSPLGGTSYISARDGFSLNGGCSGEGGITLSYNPDPFFDSVSLLLHNDTGNPVDFSKNNYSVYTLSGYISVSVRRFGAGSWFTNNNGGLYTPNTGAANLAMDTGDFTWEGWFYTTQNTSNYQTFFDSRTAAASYADGLYVGTNQGLTPIVYGTSGEIITGGSALSVNTWYHIALTRKGTDLRLFVNGTQTGSTATNSTNMSTQRLYMGIHTDGSSNRLYGFIDEIRVTKGVARYTSNFTAPNAPFPNYGQ